MNNPTVHTARDTHAIEVNKVLRNTYTLLAMTLAFSAAMAAVSGMLNLPRPGIILMLAGFYGLLFAIHKTANSAMGLVFTFALTGFMGYTIGPVLNYLVQSGGSDIVMLAMGGTALIFFSLSGYILTTKKDMSFLGGMMVAGFVVIIVAFCCEPIPQPPCSAFGSERDFHSVLGRRYFDADECNRERW